jgi:hypothetical protein
MNQEELRAIVAEDLMHIRLGPDVEIQHELRVLFNARRKKDLADGFARKETIIHCIDYIKRVYPGWRPNIDRAYFDLR